MARELYWLSDAEWGRLEPLLPRGRRGAHRVDDRRVIRGILHNCPAEYGSYTTVSNRFNRWSRQGIWLGMFEAVTGQAAVISTAALPLVFRRVPGAGTGQPS